MIESIRISGVATYGEEVEITKLGTFNYFFGPNGSGKTTVSRIIDDATEYLSCKVHWRKERPFETLVYNSDFVSRQFHEQPNLPGIFTLGEQNAETLAQIAILKSDRGVLETEIAHLNLTLNGVDGKSGKKAELLSTEETLRDKSWAAYKKCHPSLQQAFDGVRDSKQKFKQRLLKERLENQQQPRSIDELTKKAQTVFGKAQMAVSSISELSPTGLKRFEIDPILQKKIVGKADINIAALIERLGASDWVRSKMNLGSVTN